MESGAAEPSSLERVNNGGLKLADEVHKPTVRKFDKIKVYSSFKDNI